ncbi:MAG: ROK family protein [Lachnospiraceae bacterium]|nr:ROK family protein [Lachnospiraceae bacterium]
MGISVSGHDTKIGLVDIHQKIIDVDILQTNTSITPEEFISEIGNSALELLEKNGIPMDQCVGVGIGIPGTIDRKKGIVRYSNNIKWENVPVAQLMGQILPVPIRIANDADCAALGETVAGAGRGYQDVIMLTLGTGVGGGVVIDGDIYEGRGVSGSELGHMVIIENGEQCTCGRRGCLEAYASKGALVRDAKKATGVDYTAEEIIEKAANGDADLQEIVNTYIRRLGTGIVNIVNILRPQMVLLGGSLSAQGEEFIKPLSEMLKNCFGGEKGEIPDIALAALRDTAGMIGAATLF